jgi:hypothetical protein
LIGGRLTSVNGQPRGLFARLGANGNLESTATFDSGTGFSGANNGVEAIALQADGKILVGGSFTTMNGVTRNSIARLNNTPATDSVSTPNRTVVRWLRGGSAPEFSDATFELSTNGGTSWTTLGPGVPTTGGWQVSGLTLPATGTVRLRGYTPARSMYEKVQAFTVDIVTATPSLTSPASNSLVRNSLTISYTLPEAALPGSARLTFDNAGGPRVLTLGTSRESAGTHSFTFNPASPLESGAFSSAAAVPDGVYSVRLSFQDTTGNAAALSNSITGVSIDSTSPVLNLPGPIVVEAPDATGAVVNFTVSASDNLDPSPTLSVTPASGTRFGIGTTQVQISASDRSGNSVLRTLSVTVRDSIAPALGGVFAPLVVPTGVGGSAVLPDYVPQLVAVDAVGVASVVQSPVAGTSRAPGPCTVSLTATDAAGNASQTSFVVQVVDATPPDASPPAGGFAPLVLNTGVAGTVALPDYSIQVVASDNVGVTSITQSPAAGSLVGAGTTLVSVVVADAANNTRTLNFEVSVLDRTPPSIAGPVGGFSPAGLVTGAGGVVALPDYTAQAVTSDNVAVTSVTQSPLPSSAQQAGVVTVTVTARDAADNSSTVSFDVPVADGTRPEIGAPAGGFTPLSVSTGVDGTAAVPDFAAQALVSDNVGVALFTQSPAAGTPRPAGATLVTLTAVDAAGNTATRDLELSVLDATNPAISAPAGGFSPLALVTGADGTVALPDYTSQAVTSDNVAITSVSQSPLPGSPQVAGTTTVTLTARDADQNTTSIHFDVTVADSTMPALAAPEGGFTPLDLVADEAGLAALPDYTLQAVGSDNVAITTLTQTPPPGTTRSFGRTPITLTAQDAAGNTQTLSFDVWVRLPGPLRTTLATTDGPVPGAGIDPRVPADATFTSLGIPAVDDARRVAFLGKWKSASGTGSGIFAGDPPALLAAVGDEAPGVPGAQFKAIEDPMLAPNGDIAFLATLHGSGIKSKNDQGVWLSSGGDLTLIMREGTQLPGAETGLILKTIKALSLRNDGILATANLAATRPLVTSSDDAVLLAADTTGTRILLREGELIDLEDGGPAAPLKTFDWFLPAEGAPSHGRWHAQDSSIGRITLADKRSGLLQVHADGTFRLRAAIGQQVPAIGPSAYWSKTFGLPAIETNGQGVLFNASIKTNEPALATNKSDTLIAYQRDAQSPIQLIARESQTAPGTASAYAKFSDPLLNAQNKTAFTATLSGPDTNAKNNTAIFWGDVESPPLLARLGTPAPDETGTASTALWKKFISLALPDGPNAGPILLANISGNGVTKRDNIALFAMDTNGVFRRILRTGELIEGAPITAIQALSPAVTSPATNRGFNARGTVVTRILLKSKQSILRFDLPDGSSRSL